MTDPPVEDPDLGDGERDVVFLSYSHADAVWAQRFQVMLAPLLRPRRWVSGVNTDGLRVGEVERDGPARGLELWIDTDRLQVGEEWRVGLDAAIARARVALLLVSEHYLASSFINDYELPALVRPDVVLVPVLVGDCLWRHEPRLERRQWLHDPGRDGPLNLLKSGRRTQQLRVLSERLLAVVSDLPATGWQPPRPSTPRVGPVRTSALVAEVPAGKHAGRLVGVPGLPPGYVAREELAGLIAAATATEVGGGAVGVTGAVSPIGLYGQGGIGKSVLAAALTREEDIRSRFPDGIFWVSVGEHGDVLAAQLHLLAQLDVRGRAPSTVAEATERLSEVLAPRRLLLVVDDVWNADAARAFRVSGPRGRVVYTSRDPAVVNAVDAEPYQVDVLSADAARALAAGVLNQQASGLPSTADRVFDRVGRVALAVALLAAAVRGRGRSWEDIDADLDVGEEAFGQHPYANAFKAMQIAVAALPDELYQGLLGLAVFPGDIAIPVAAIIRYWVHTRGRTPSDTILDIQWLAAAGVLQHQDGQIVFHDLQYDYLLLHAPPPRELHTNLLDAYRCVLPAAPFWTVGSEWWRLPAAEPYIGDHLAAHLRAAGAYQELLATVTDPAYLARRVDAAGGYAAEADLVQAAAVHPAEARVAWWRGWLARHSHLLVPVRPACSPTGEPGDTAGATESVVSTFAVWLRADTTRVGYAVDWGRLDPLLPRPRLCLRRGLAPPATALIRVLTGHPSGVWAVGWSPDGSRLVSGGEGGMVRVWDAGSGQRLHALAGHASWVWAVGWSPDGSRLASGGDETVRVWAARSGRLLHTLTGHTGGVRAVGWSPDGTWLASGGDRTVRVWDAVSGRQLHILTGHASWVRAVGWSPDGSRLVSAGEDGTVRVWDAASGWLLHTLTGHTNSVKAVGWSPDGNRLASGGGDETVRVWDAASGRLLHTLTGHIGPVRSVGWSPDGNRLISGGDITIRIWLATPNQHDTTDQQSDRMWAVRWSPDGTLLASGGGDGTVRVWEARSGRLLRALTGHTGGVSAVEWSPKGWWLATGGGDETVRVWEARSGRLLRALTGHTGGVSAVDWSPDESRLASSGGDTVRVWGVKSAQLLHTLPQWGIGTLTKRLLQMPSGHTDLVRAIRWSPDGTLLASGGDDSRVRVWAARSGRLLHTLTEHTGGVSAVEWSPDRNRLASGGGDGTVRVWEARSGRLLRALTGHTGGVSAVGWSPDGNCLVSVGEDGRLVLWPPPPSSTPHLHLQLDELAAVTWTAAGIAVGGANGVAVFDLR